MQPFSVTRLGIGSQPDRWKEQNAIAPEITFEGSETSDAARAQISSEIQRLDTHHHRITGCRVKVIAPSHKHRHGTGFQVHIWLTVPPHENIVVNQSGSSDARHEHAYVAIRDAFAAVRRQVDALANQSLANQRQSPKPGYLDG
ncbi:MAG: ribosome-associated translation inhibitor RaiA [Bradyrhizobium sp.]|nr:ribosome-associated translation inhibitor RaiA [Bradyrhizobium sp.]